MIKIALKELDSDSLDAIGTDGLEVSIIVFVM